MEKIIEKLKSFAPAFHGDQIRFCLYDDYSGSVQYDFYDGRGYKSIFNFREVKEFLEADVTKIVEYYIDDL